MKKSVKIIIAVLSLILAINLVVIVGLASKGVFETEVDENLDKEQALSAEWIKREDLPKAKTVVLSDEVKTEKKLTYESSRKISDDQIIDVYHDENGAEFRYEKERLMAYSCSEKNRDLKEKEIEIQKGALDENKAIEIARRHLKEVYGEDLTGYVMDEIYDDGNGGFRVFFRMKYGEEDFVSGATASADIDSTGEVYFSCLPYEKYLDFNEALLNGITQETINEYIEKRLEEDYESKLKSYKVKSICINCIDDKYCLEIGVTVVLENSTDLGIESAKTKIYRYALE